MVIDTLDNLYHYEVLNPLFKEVADFLKSSDFNEMEDGKYVIKEGALFLNLTIAKGTTPDKALMETHNEMIDIQIPISSTETFGYSPRCDLPETVYDTEKDITKYPGVLAQSYITCRPGMFAIFFPQDGHAPCISMEKEFRKAIFKVKNRI